MECKNLTHTLLQLFEHAFNEEFWRSESGIVEAYALFNNGEQLDCEMVSTVITQDCDGKNMELSVLLGDKEYKVSIQALDVQPDEEDELDE